MYDPSMTTTADRGLERAAELFRALADDLDAGQSRLSFHLKTLKDAGLLRDRRQGRWVYYALDRDAVAEALEVLDRLGRGLRQGARRGD